MGLGRCPVNFNSITTVKVTILKAIVDEFRELGLTLAPHVQDLFSSGPYMMSMQAIFRSISASTRSSRRVIHLSKNKKVYVLRFRDIEVQHEVCSCRNTEYGIPIPSEWA